MKQSTCYRFVRYKRQILCNGITGYFFFLLFFPVCLFSQVPAVQWNKTLGGSLKEAAKVIKQTADGGFILGGYSLSDASGDKTENNKGLSDYWVVKLDPNGNKLWDKTIGGTGDEYLNSLQQTTDNGYILGGYSSSNISGDKSENSKGGDDYWVVKLDASGNKIWDKTIGGNYNDILLSLQQTADNGYILGGYSSSNISGDKSENSKGVEDYWVVKLDPNGNKIWDKTIGGNNFDFSYSINQTIDYGYILGGYSQSNISGDKSENSKGGIDYWVVKLDASGNKIWDKTIGGNNNDVLYSIKQTTDNGYILGGYSSSNISGDKSENSKGGDDYWVVKLDASGNKIWDKTIGGNYFDYLISVQQTIDNGYILGGSSFSGISGDKTENNKGHSDYWVVKLGANGTKLWDKTIGGNNSDALLGLQQTADNGYILAGYSQSNISGDKTENSRGEIDYWVVKLNPESTPTLTINCTPYVNLCYNASQTYTVPPLETSGDLGIESISYTIYRYPLIYGPCEDNPEVYCPLSLRSGTGANASGAFPQQMNSDLPTSYEIWWAVLDVNGNWHYCHTRVTIYSQITINVPDVYAVSPGGNANTIYLGYGPSSLTLSAQAAGGNPDPDYTYNWSTGETGPTITVSPNTVGTHIYSVTVTDATGCTSSSTKTITVVDIRTPGKPGKVNICHRDLKGKWTTLSVLASSVAEHLANHGDYLGICNTPPPSIVEVGKAAEQINANEITANQFKIYPNPATHFLDVQWTSANTSQSTIRILNAEGRVVKTLTTKSGVYNQRISLNGLAKGIYMVVLKTGSDQQVSKFVIQ